MHQNNNFTPVPTPPGYRLQTEGPLTATHRLNGVLELSALTIAEYEDGG